jgi:hypothetical protein
MFKQATALLLFSGALVFAQTEKEGKEAKYEYKPPVVEKLIFDESITMLDQERHEYSSNLATYAANQLISKKASPQSLEALAASSPWHSIWNAGTGRPWWSTSS